jgi:hypothetical protein
MWGVQDIAREGGGVKGPPKTIVVLWHAEDGCIGHAFEDADDEKQVLLPGEAPFAYRIVGPAEVALPHAPDPGPEPEPSE